MGPELALDIYPLLGTIRWYSQQLEDSNSFNSPILGAAFKIPIIIDEETDPKGK